MGIKSLCFLFIVLLFSSFCHGNDKSVLEVVGHGDCADCGESNIKSRQVFSGLHVNVDCKAPNGEIKTRGEGNLDNEGKFIVSLPQEILENGKLKEECFAKLLSASHKPCPTHNGIDSSKLIFKTKTNGKHIFTTSQKLKFSPITCTSKPFLKHFMYPPIPKWKKHFPFYKKPYPPLPKWKKHFPFYKKPYSPLPKWKKHFSFYKKPCPTLAPIFKKPLPPSSVPIYKPTPKPPIYKPIPKPPVYTSPPYVKPLPPPIPVYKPKPKPPVYEPKPKPPVYKPPPYVKPLPPPVPVYKKPLLPPVPIYKKPLPPYYKTLPPFPTIPKKPPCPPLPKLPLHPKKYFHHPIFAPWPPHSP